MRPFTLAILALIVNGCIAGTETRQAAVNRAIEQTKSRQNSASGPQRVPQRANVRLNAEQPTTSSPGKMETIDVEKLNKLIRGLDKTWVMPKAGSKDPVGSNFQYKKTCASIFKARHGACQQLGFGVMCFNYCHERGEKLSFKCQDTSDASYCKQSGTFDTFLAKYRKDGYKAKAYIHQMISRCYATTICNTQSGILNSTIINEEQEVVEKPKNNRLKPLTKRPGSNGNPLALMKLKTKLKPTTTTTPAPEEVIEEEEIVDGGEEEVEEEITTTTTKKAPRVVKKKPTNVLTLKSRPSPPTPAPEIRTTTTKANIWDKFTIGNKAKPTPKYIPFWQRLMSTTLKPTEDEATEAEETTTDEMEETEEATTVAEIEETVLPETTPTDAIPDEDIVMLKSKVHKTNAESPSSSSSSSSSPQSPSTSPSAHTFKPLPVTVPSTGPELSHQKPNEDMMGSAHGPGFWNRFQPNRWFESIHYVTNTGK